MAGTVTTNEIGQYYPPLQSLLSEIQGMVPPGPSSNAQQGQALSQIVNAATAENAQFKGLLASSLDDQVTKYVDVSNRLNDFNEIYNTNKYIKKELTKADRELEHKEKQLKSMIYITKQKSQMYDYERNKLNFYRNLFLVSCFVIVELLVMVAVHLNGLTSAKWLYTTVGISVAAYLLVVYIIVYSNSYRSHQDWNKFVWGVGPNGTSKQQTCSS